MYSLKKIAFRFFQANKFIVISSIISIAIAAILVMTMLLYSLSANQAMEEQIKNLYGDMDLSVGFNLEQEKAITSQMVEEIEKMEEIQHLSKVYVTHFSLDDFNMEIYTVGVENDTLAQGRYHFHENIDKNSVILNKGLADSLGLQVGDRVSIENNTFIVSEINGDIKGSSKVPDMMILYHSAVKELLKNKNQSGSEATYMMIKANEGANLLLLSNKLKSIDEDFRIDLVEEEQFVKDNFRSLTIYLVVISFLVLIVTGFLINSNFELLLYKMTNQFAIMRSLGASSKQLGKLIFFQGIGINIIGVLLGFIMTYISYEYIFRLLEKMFSLPSTSGDFNIEFACLISIVFFILVQLFIMVPVIKGSKVLPMKLLEENEKLDFGFSRARKIFYRILLGIAIFLIALSQVIPRKEEIGIFLVLIAALLLIIGLFLILPVHISKVFQWIVGPVHKYFGHESFIAIKNLIPQIKKNTRVILVITVFMIITVFGSTMLKTIDDNERDYLKNQFVTPILVESRLFDETDINPISLSEEIEKIDTVQGTYTLSNYASADLKIGNGYEAIEYRLADLGRLIEQNRISPIENGDLSSTLVISQSFSEKFQLKLGDMVTLGLYSEEAQEVENKGQFQIGAITDSLQDYADVYMDWSNPIFNNANVVFQDLYVETNHEKETLQQINSLKSVYPELKVTSYMEAEKEREKQFLQRWAIFMIVLGALLMTTLMGVYVALTNNIFSKRKEYSVLRILGIQPKGIKKVITTQVFAYIIMGLGYGLLIGLLLAFTIYLIDPAQVSFDIYFLTVLVALILFTTKLFTIIVGKNISKRKIIDEITADNK